MDTCYSKYDLKKVPTCFRFALSQALTRYIIHPKQMPVAQIRILKQHPSQFRFVSLQVSKQFIICPKLTLIALFMIRRIYHARLRFFL